MTSEAIAKQFGRKLRVRVMGLLIENDTVLLIKHIGLGEKGYLWSPPGGGMEYGTTAEENLKREFLEETGLEIKVKDFLFVCELVQPPLHAIELFFTVTLSGGSLFRGSDPEMDEQDQIIKEIKFMSWLDMALLPPPGLHKAFHGTKNHKDLLKRKGYYKI